MSDTTDHVELFNDSDGQWRWRRIAANNKIVSVCGEGFVDRSYAEDSAAKYNSDVADFRVNTDPDNISGDA
jgi:uncharacterized protein YegP (UPF0339 family)